MNIDKNRNDCCIHAVHMNLNINTIPAKRPQLGNFERGGRSYIYNRKDEIIHGLSPSVKSVAPLFSDMSLAKV